MRATSTEVKAFLNYFLNDVLDAEASIDTLVVSGVSIGTMAVLNHFETIQSVAEAAGVKSLRVIMDGFLHTDQMNLDFISLYLRRLWIQMNTLCVSKSRRSYTKTKTCPNCRVVYLLIVCYVTAIPLVKRLAFRKIIRKVILSRTSDFFKLTRYMTICKLSLS